LGFTSTNWALDCIAIATQKKEPIRYFID